MSAETFNACVYLVDRQVEAGHGDHLPVTGDALPKTATGKIQRVVVREVVAQRLGKAGE